VDLKGLKRRREHRTTTHCDYVWEIYPFSRAA